MSALRRRILPLPLLALLTGAPTAFGCDLCAGKPTDSHLVDGAIAGVAVMIALIALVQVGIVAVIMFWMRRAKALEAAAAARVAATGDADPWSMNGPAEV